MSTPVEVLAPVDRITAERLDKRLRLMAGSAREGMEKVGRLLDEAKRGQIQHVLGFPSWPAYVADALGGTLQLSIEARQAMVQLMASEGMSERAIAKATGAGKTTVHRDLEVVRCGPPDGADDVVSLPAERASSVTGTDGKTYSRPTPAPRPPRPSRRGHYTSELTPLRNALREVPKQVAKFDRFADDDQFCAWFGEVDSRIADVRRQIAKAIEQLQRMDQRVQQVAAQVGAE